MSRICWRCEERINSNEVYVTAWLDDDKYSKEDYKPIVLHINCYKDMPGNNNKIIRKE